MSPKQFIRDLKAYVYCRLGVSKIAGVGVFAIRLIPKGIDPFVESRNYDFIEIPARDIRHDTDIPETVKKLVVDMCPERDGVFYAPSYSMNEVSISWFLNHSETPNMEEVNDGESFRALRDIQEGEELTVNYGTYSELNL